MKTAITGCCLTIAAAAAAQKGAITTYLTDPANNILFQQQTTAPVFSKKKAGTTVIIVDDGPRYQGIDGFGWALTGGSAGHLQGMSQPARTALLKELFSPAANGIGGSYIRLSIGASDLDEKVFSYNDLPAGEADVDMKRFDLGPDRVAVIPIVKEILAINPKIKIMGSPWSPPVWMKTNGDVRGGSLKKEYFPAYAKYFVKYIQAMQAEGIRIESITVQNEPLHPGNTPSLLMLATDQGEFVRDHLGPAFQQAGLKTRIIIYDHNADKPEYPISILDDPGAKKYIDGSAFHLYGGKIEALSKVHEAHPDKNLYFTEQWVGAPGNLKRDIAEHVRNLIIGASRNWSRTVIEWNLTSNPQLKPHTDRGGCDRCLGAVTVDKDEVKRNPAYYSIAHAGKFVHPGSVRIASNVPGALPNVAFVNPLGQLVLVVLNDNKETTTFDVQYKKKTFTATLPAGGMATYVWKK